MKSNIILDLKKLNEVDNIDLKDFIEFSLHSSVIANKTIVHEEFYNMLFHTDVFNNKEELNSKLSNLSNDIDVIVKSLNRLNIKSDILIEVTDIDVEPYISPSDLD